MFQVGTHLEQQMAAAEEVSTDTVIASVTSEPESISSLKDEQRRTLRAFLHGQGVFAPLPAGFSKSLI